MLKSCMVALLLLAALLVAALPAGAQRIRIAFESPCGTCLTFANIGQPTPFWINLQGPPASNTMSGAEFRIVGLPENWIVVVNPPGPIDICQPNHCDVFGMGAWLTYPECQTGHCQTLFTGVIVPTDATENVVLEARPLPMEPLNCPVVRLCDGPAFTKVCVACDPAYVNHSDGGCALAVDGTSWSNIKGLYR